MGDHSEFSPRKGRSDRATWQVRAVALNGVVAAPRIARDVGQQRSVFGATGEVW